MIRELRPGIHTWTARHPEWHPADAFGAEVASYALTGGGPGGALLLVDPLVPDDTPGLLDDLAEAATSVAIFITIGYHVRSTAQLCERYQATAYGPDPARRRLPEIQPLEQLPHGVSAHAFGRPRRSERVLHFPSHDALAFGDALVTTPEGELRTWAQDEDTPRRHAFYAERFAPTLEPLAALRPRHILTTHGPPHLDKGSNALRDCAVKPPWFRHS